MYSKGYIPCRLYILYKIRKVYDVLAVYCIFYAMCSKGYILYRIHCIFYIRYVLYMLC